MGNLLAFLLIMAMKDCLCKGWTSNIYFRLINYYYNMCVVEESGKKIYYEEGVAAMQCSL